MSDRQNKLSILSALAKMHTVNVFQGCLFFFFFKKKKESSSQYILYTYTCVVAVRKEGGKLQTVNTSL